MLYKNFINHGKYYFMYLPTNYHQFFIANELNITKSIDFKNFNEHAYVRDFFPDLKYLLPYYFSCANIQTKKNYDREQEYADFLFLRKFDENKLFIKAAVKLDLIDLWYNTINNRILEYNTTKEIENFKLNILNFKLIHKTKQLNLKNNKPIIFLNMVKWSWKQWLHFDLTEKEKLKLFKKNTLLFNERYNIWSLKLAPIRIKLPIKLELPLEKLDEFLKGQLLRDLEGRFFLFPWRVTNPILKRFSFWHRFKLYILKLYNNNVDEKKKVMILMIFLFD